MLVPHDHFFDEDRIVRTHRDAGKTLLKIGGVVDSKRGGSAGSCGGLDDEGKSERFGCLPDFFDRMRRAMSSTRNTCLVENGLHAVFVAKIQCSFGTHAGNAEVLASLCQRDLNVFDRAKQSVNRGGFGVFLQVTRSLLDFSGSSTSIDGACGNDVTGGLV